MIPSSHHNVCFILHSGLALGRSHKILFGFHSALACAIEEYRTKVSQAILEQQ